MAKAILVVDMPENCIDCRLWHTDDEYPEDFCGVDYENISNLLERPDWCPLIPEPKKYPHRGKLIHLNNLNEILDLEDIYFEKGWNACLDALEGRDG